MRRGLCARAPRRRSPASAGSSACGGRSLSKRWVRAVPGLIDFAAVQAELAARGIELRGGAADEAPLAYKRLPDVLAHHAGTVAVLHELRPIGVAMAGAHTFDPYKD